MKSGPRRPSAYRLRIIAGFTIVIGLLSAAWAWSLYVPLDATVRDQQEARLTDLARAVAAVTEAGDVSLDAVSRSIAGSSDVRITIIAEDGTVLSDSQEDVASLENHGDRPEVRAALSGKTGTDTRRSDTQGVERMYVAVPAKTASGEIIAVRTSESLERIAALSSQARRAGLMTLAVVLALAALTAWGATRAAARPVERLAEAARTMASGDLASPVPDEPGGFGPLSDALSSLRLQLRERLSALEAERQTLRVALDGMSDGIVLLSGNRVELANQALAGMFRLPPGEIVGRDLASLGLPASIEAAIHAGERQDLPSSVDLGPDPFQRYHRVVTVPLGIEAGGHRTLVAVTDATDRMRLDAVRRDFVSNASHELKTPTASILLLAETAQQAAADGDTAQAAAFVSQIADEASRLRKMVAELLDLSRLESVPGSGEISDVRRSVELALAAHRRAAAAKDLGLSADLSALSGLDVAARVGSTDLAVALDNLLSNAITYTERGSVGVRVEADDATVRISVTDTGIGIPDEDVERVFERFYRVDRARSRTSGGTGLGLALVRNVAERAGGSVGIISELGRGTTVTLELPRAR